MQQLGITYARALGQFFSQWRVLLQCGQIMLLRRGVGQHGIEIMVASWQRTGCGYESCLKVVFDESELALRV